MASIDAADLPFRDGSAVAVGWHGLGIVTGGDPTPEGHLPRHVGVIMDGNGRWAKQRHRPRLYGHRAGLKALRRFLYACDDLGIRTVTIYAFSTENWSRPVGEVSGLMGIFVRALAEEFMELHEHGVQVRFSGRRSGLSPQLTAMMEQAEALTRENRYGILNVLFNYGGRTELVDAARSIVARGLPADQIDEATLAGSIYNPDLPDLDLIIRTGGEQRLSNFLMWQAPYAELYFTEKLWPDFGAEDLRVALADYAARVRRYGGIRSR
jgi:undecaprenyl diphosphate synthase